MFTNGGAGGTSPTLGGGNGGNGGKAVIPITGQGASPSLGDGGSGSGGDSSVSTVACTDGAGCNCPTFNIAVIGKAGKWGAASNGANGGDGDGALQAWLNSSSAGSAKVDNFQTKPTLTADFLATYNVIILQALGDDSNQGPFWSFDGSEVGNLMDWVNAGGGLITLSGFASDNNETVPLNKLLLFSGISYNTDGISPDCTIPNSLCWCGGSYPVSEWVKTDPLVANLSNSVTWIGMASGRSINAPADAHVAATVTPSGQSPKNVLVGKISGSGRVLAYSDEWLTYTSQWTGAGNPNTTNTACAGALPQDIFQTSQFWFNMIKWVQPSATCFKIVDNSHPVILW